MKELQKNSGHRLKAIVLGLIVALGVFCSACSSNEGQTPSTDAPPKVEQSSPPAQEADTPQEESKNIAESNSSEPVSIDFSSGYYTAGIDFPAGKYNITAVNGGGNVISDNMFDGGINAIMGVGEDELYEKEYKNIKLPAGTVLSIDSVTVNLSCEKPDGGTKPREQPNTETVDLGNGNFVAGEDFPAGVYDVVAVSGSGNVFSDNDLNAILGVEDDGLSQKQYKNVDLPEGITLTIDGVKIQLIPSK